MRQFGLYSTSFNLQVEGIKLGGKRRKHNIVCIEFVSLLLIHMLAAFQSDATSTSHPAALEPHVGPPSQQ